MPNHITNIVAVSGDESRIQAMLKAVQNDEHGVGSLDFNKIIPMPDNCDSYHWCIANWGTKWNSYGYTGNIFFENGKITFYTAWSAPHHILEKLSEMYPDIKFEHEWADEDIGSNCGRYAYFDGECIEEYFPESSRDRIEFAARVMESDPSNWGLYLNASETDYVNFSDEEFEIIEVEGQSALFTNSRMTDANIPKGLHCYHLRHGDDGSFCSLEKSVTVDHGGSVIVREPIKLGENGCISLNNENAPNFTGETTLMEEFFSEEEMCEDLNMSLEQ